MILIVLVHASSSGQTHATISVIVNSLVSRGEESAHPFSFPLLSLLSRFHSPMVCSVSCAMLECQEKVVSSAGRATVEGERGMGKFCSAMKCEVSWCVGGIVLTIFGGGEEEEDEEEEEEEGEEEEEESVTTCL
eukprot:TsM_001085900 transcript=TsM_001085900 gene=TsM_001085900